MWTGHLLQPNPSIEWEVPQPQSSNHQAKHPDTYEKPTKTNHSPVYILVQTRRVIKFEAIQWIVLSHISHTFGDKWWKKHETKRQVRIRHANHTHNQHVHCAIEPFTRRPHQKRSTSVGHPDCRKNSSHPETNNPSWCPDSLQGLKAAAW